MEKNRRTIRALIPGYQKDRHEWRKGILETVLRVQTERGVRYDKDSLLEVVVLLYLKRGKRLAIHDVDNRLKDILDALQGRCGPKTDPGTPRLIENDRQVSRVVVEKQPIPKSLGDDAGGRILIRPYRPRHWPLQRTKASPFKKPKRGRAAQSRR